MNKKLLLEVYRGSNLPKVAESQEGVPSGCMLVEGVLAIVNEVNRNKRFYPKDMYGKHIKEMQSRIVAEGGIPGEMEHPESMTINLANVSHKISEVWINENTGCVMGKLMLLDTPNGLIAQSIVKSGMPLPISSRAVGTVGESGAVNLDYLSTFDLVGTPGFKQASLHRVSESLDSNGTIVSESFEYDLDTNGHVVKESAGFDEKLISEMIDSKITEAVNRININKGNVTEDSVRAIVKSYVSETAAPDIQSYLDGELDSRLSESDGAGLNRAGVIKLMNERFINSYAPTIQKWSINEFAPGIQDWFINEASSGIQNWAINEFAPGIQNWFINEASSGIQNWAINEFAPGIQGWAINEFASNIQGWAINEFAPEIQNWFVNEAAGGIQNWAAKEFVPITEASIVGKQAKAIHNNKSIGKIVFSGSYKELMNSKYDKYFDEEIKNDYPDDYENNIDYVVVQDKSKFTVWKWDYDTTSAMLNEASYAPVDAVKESVLDKSQNTETVLERLDTLISSANSLSKSKITESAEDIAKRKINENFKHAPAWLQYIPEQHKLTWLALSEAAKTEISRNANVRNFSTQQDIDEFWDTRDFTNLTTAKRFTEVKKLHESVKVEKINENKKQNGIAAFAQGLR